MFTKEAAIFEYRDDENTSNSTATPIIRNLPEGYDQLMQNNVSTEAIIHALKKTSSEGASIFIKVKSRCFHKIKLQNISYIEAQADYMLLHTSEKIHVIHITMCNILKKLPKTDFARVHKSYIVRLDLISKIEDNMIVLHDTLIPLGKGYEKAFFSNLNIAL